LSSFGLYNSNFCEAQTSAVKGHHSNGMSLNYISLLICKCLMMAFYKSRNTQQAINGYTCQFSCVWRLYFLSTNYETWCWRRLLQQ